MHQTHGSNVQPNKVFSRSNAECQWWDFHRARCWMVKNVRLRQPRHEGTGRRWAKGLTHATNLYHYLMLVRRRNQAASYEYSGVLRGGANRPEGTVVKAKRSVDGDGMSVSHLMKDQQLQLPPPEASPRPETIHASSVSCGKARSKLTKKHAKGPAFGS